MKKMLATLKSPVIRWRLKKWQWYLAHSVPLAMDGQQVNIDETAIETYVRSLPPAQVEELKERLRAQFNKKAKPLPFDGRELENESPLPLRTVVMASPEKLTDYTRLSQKTDIFEDWFCIRHALVKAGAHVEVIPTAQENGGFREVYTRDRYVMVGNTAYLPDPDFVDRENIPGINPADVSEYRGEIRQAEENLRKLGIPTVIVKNAWFEGGNVVRHYSSRTLFLGLDGISTEYDAQKLIEAVNATQPQPWSIQPVPLTNMPDMYHLDTGMSEELPRGEVMISPEVTGPETYKKICAIVGPENIIELSEGEAAALATNMIDIGDTLIMTGNSRSLRDKLESRGYSVVMPENYGRKSFEFGQGGVHCMTNDVRQPPTQFRGFRPSI